MFFVTSPNRDINNLNMNQHVERFRQCSFLTLSLSLSPHINTVLYMTCLWKRKINRPVMRCKDIRPWIQVYSLLDISFSPPPPPSSSSHRLFTQMFVFSWHRRENQLAQCHLTGKWSETYDFDYHLRKNSSASFWNGSFDRPTDCCLSLEIERREEKEMRFVDQTFAPVTTTVKWWACREQREVNRIARDVAFSARLTVVFFVRYKQEQKQTLQLEIFTFSAIHSPTWDWSYTSLQSVKQSTKTIFLQEWNEARWTYMSGKESFVLSSCLQMMIMIHGRSER